MAGSSPVPAKQQSNTIMVTEKRFQKKRFLDLLIEIGILLFLFFKRDVPVKIE